MRGNPPIPTLGSSTAGSIPARAGEPRLLLPPLQSLRVYPRACGGTSGRPWVGICQTGLSPRVRGNPDHGRLRLGPEGSIPARAGEPLWDWMRTDHAAVYPRACGGTLQDARLNVAIIGLSPRVRGNLERRLQLSLLLRSIPARAGEPARCAPRAPQLPVYPRACGGTACESTRADSNGGLSPRVRGNQVLHVGRVKFSGSIPARAGEPILAGTGRGPTRVYPRACGGTAGAGLGAGVAIGLSPRVRGNPYLIRDFGDKLRSIPARAGEPSKTWRSF